MRRPTLRSKLTWLYAALFLASGLLLLLIINAGVRSTGSVEVVGHPDHPIPEPPAIARIDPLITQHETDLRHLATFSAIALLIMLVLSFAVGRFTANRALRPLREITATARDISATNLHARLNVDGPRDEITELGSTLDDLFSRLEASFESQRHFVANASHELRTPLTAERTLLQVALADPDASAESLRSTCEAVLALGDHQERLIDALLTLATSERGIERRETFDLEDIAEPAVASRSSLATERGVQVEASLHAAPVRGDRSLVESLIANLLDNSLRHNVVGGRVELSTSTVAGRGTFAIRNTGPVVPPDEVDRLFQPFQRLGGERVDQGDGNGLGLAIVSAIADVHGATLVSRARPDGGLDIEVAFPPSG